MKFISIFLANNSLKANYYQAVASTTAEIGELARPILAASCIGQNPARYRGDDFASRRFLGGDACEFCRWFCGMALVKAQANISYLPTVIGRRFACL